MGYPRQPRQDGLRPQRRGVAVQPDQLTHRFFAREEVSNGPDVPPGARFPRDSQRCSSGTLPSRRPDPVQEIQALRCGIGGEDDPCPASIRTGESVAAQSDAGHLRTEQRQADLDGLRVSRRHPLGSGLGVMSPRSGRTRPGGSAASSESSRRPRAAAGRGNSHWSGPRPPR
jgi:hypothetical protein